MAVIIYLFILIGNLASVSAWVYSAFLMFIFFNLIQGKKVSFFRRIYFVTFSLLFSISYIVHLLEAFNGMALNEAAVLTNGIPFNQFLIPVLPFFLVFARTVQFPSPISGGILSVFGLVLVWIMATLVIGKGWCGWVCPFGGYEDFFSRVLKRPILSISRFGKKIRQFHLLFLAVVVVLSAVLLMPVYVYWLNPFTIITGRFTSGGLHGTVMFLLSLLLFITLVVVLPLLTRKRFQCSAYCPLGALQTLTNSVSSFKIVIDPDACNHCMKCVEACQFCAIDDGGAEVPIISKACAFCGECIDICLENAIRYEYGFVKSLSDIPKGKTVLGKILLDVFAPSHMFVLAAFTFCVFFSSHFAVDALDFLLNFIRSVV
ncbi:MAG TPA: 4Fe-4S binding protein [Treponema sp.]|nr:4Fe-4S binding protein [Treponema sp.]